MQDLIEEIKKTDADGIEKILKAVLSRYSVLFPGWELCTVSLLKSNDRNEQLDQMIAVLQKMKTLPKR